MRASRLLAFVAATLLAASLVVVGIGYRHATADPLIRRLVLRVRNYPSGAPPVRIVLFSDLHVHGPDMPPARVARIVEQINALHPDIVVGAGDFIGDNWIGREYPVDDAIAPLGRLKARLGVFAVLGNNDYDTGAPAIRSALARGGIRVLEDQAVSVGPVALGGLDGIVHRPRDQWRQARLKTYEALARTPGVKILAAHRNDEIVPAPLWVPLVLAGHTHCGQIVLPFVGAVESGSDYGSRFLCGVIRDRSKTLVVTAGVGTSHLPLRFGASPDMWLISITGR